MIGAVLAGADASSATLAGRPLHAWAQDALAAVCEPVEVVSFSGGPLAGIVDALEQAGGPVLVCGADMPFVTPDACRTVLEAAGAATGPAVVAAAGGVLQPAFGLYAPAAVDGLRAGTVEALEPVKVALPPAMLQTVSSPEELEEAGKQIARSRPGRLLAPRRLR